MKILIAIALYAGLAVAWLTALALLNDVHMGRAEFKDAVARIRDAWRHLWRYGYDVVNWDGLRASVRPFLQAIVRIGIVGCAFAAAIEALFKGLPHPFATMTLLLLAVSKAMHVPCPAFTYIFRGDRRKSAQPYPGEDRRAH